MVELVLPDILNYHDEPMRTAILSLSSNNSSSNIHSSLHHNSISSNRHLSRRKAPVIEKWVIV